jgi:hypothetical protein
MSAIHDAARTVEQAARDEEAALAAMLDEETDLRHQIDATEERLRNLRERLAICVRDIDAQRLANEQADKLAEVVRHLDIKAAPAPAGDVGTPEYERALASHAAAPDRTHAFPVYVPMDPAGDPTKTQVAEVTRDDA